MRIAALTLFLLSILFMPTMIVRANTAPTHTEPSILYGNTLADVTAYNQSTYDADGDPVTKDSAARMPRVRQGCDQYVPLSHGAATQSEPVAEAVARGTQTATD